MKVFQAALLAAAAEARFNQFQSIVDSLLGRSSNNDVIRRQVPALFASSPGIGTFDDVFEDNFTWTYEEADSTSVKSYKDSPVAPLNEGIRGDWEIRQEDDGSNWLKIDLESGWTKEFQSHNKFNSYYGAISWLLASSDDITLNSSGVTMKGDSVEVSILGAKRNPSDSATAATPALQFDSLLQATTGLTSIDLGQEGLASLGGDIDTDAPTPTAWDILNLYSLDSQQGKKKYIGGIRLKAERPFQATSSRRSAMQIKNQEDYVFCATTWMANSNINIQQYQGCAILRVDLPVPPPPEEPEDEVVVPEEEEEETKDTGSGASTLALSAFAAITLAAVAF